jgi:integrase
MKHKLTPAFVANPPVPSKDRAFYWEGSFGLMVTDKGHKSYVVQYRAGRQSRRMSLKDGLSLQEARREAKKILGDVARGGDPLGERRKAAGATLRAVAEEYFARELGKLRTASARKRVIERLVLPVMGSRPIDTIMRSEIVRLLDKVETENGPHQAQAVLVFLSKIFNWHASRHDDFLSPIRRGMARTKFKETARDRVLSDDELRAVWKAAQTFPGPYGRLVRFLLLTATRRGEAARMVRGELHGSDWIIPAARMKANLEYVVPLSPAARTIIDSMPELGAFVFTIDGRRATSNFAADKRRFDEVSGVSNWRIHDLRRTARSLMSRAGVTPDIAERCLAHTIGGVRGAYDRYAFHKEKKQAFESLAELVAHIVDPADNVVPIRRQS